MSQDVAIDVLQIFHENSALDRCVYLFSYFFALKDDPLDLIDMSIPLDYLEGKCSV